MKRIALAVAVLAAAFAPVLAGAAPASARPQPGERLSHKKPFEKTYPPLNGAYPGNWDPGTCAQAHVEFCDTIPFFIEEPKDIPPGDDFFVEVTLSYNSGPESDMDLFVYDDGQTEQEKDDQGTRSPDEPPRLHRYTTKGANTTGQNPLVVRIPEPRLGKYNIVPTNTSGINPGYTVSARFIIIPYTPPKEYLGEDETPVTEDEFGEDFGTGGSGGRSTSDGALTPGGPGGPVDRSLDAVDPLADGDLDGLAGLARRSKNRGLATGEVDSALPTSSVPPPPPSGVTLLFWLALFPGGMMGGLAFWLLKRRRAGFSFG